MKPMNFPGRKNSRRIRAMGQLQRAKNTKAARLGREPGFHRAAEIERLQSLIVSEPTARGMRTKKDGSSRARFHRAA